MNLRHKRRNNHIQSFEQNFQPTVGLLNPVSKLSCYIQPQQHHFNINFLHLLEIFTRLTRQCKKNAFEKLISATFDVNIEEKTTFIPQALLTGKYEVIHEYKKMLQRTKVDSYIKLNIRHQEKSYQKKKPVSLDLRESNQLLQTESNHIFSKVFNQKTFNEKTTKKTNEFLHVSEFKHQNEAKNETPHKQNKKDRSLMTSRLSYSKVNEENVDIRLNIEQYRDIRTVHHTSVHHVKKSKSSKKSRPMDGIKINYIAVKGSNQNPEKSTFVFKSIAGKTNRQPSEFGAKSEFNSPHIIHFDKTLNNDLSFSVHNENDKISMHSHFKQADDNISEHYGKSLKNSEMSQLTHNELYSKNFIFNDRRILKKGRRSVFVESFEKKQIL